MRTLFSYAVLLATSFAVFAGPNDPVSLPEPGVFALIGVGIAALLISRRTKK
ncbi:MAG: PEP-CTERM sorting domain-containing protein [Gammaproteobacteria bacterium]|nr:PEP-CTERM sorting domain-containing protein [Gammaproteobacteria bacterium]